MGLVTGQGHLCIEQYLLLQTVSQVCLDAMDLWVSQHVQFMYVNTTNLDMIVRNNLLEFKYSFRSLKYPEIICKILYEKEETILWFPILCLF